MASIDLTHAPYGDLAIVAMKGCEEIAKQVDYYLMQWRGTPSENSFVINANCPRFGTGEAKVFSNIQLVVLTLTLFATALTTALPTICTVKKFL